MKEITLIIKIDISETENAEAVLRSFVKTAATARKAEFVTLSDNAFEALAPVSIVSPILTPPTLNENVTEDIKEVDRELKDENILRLYEKAKDFVDTKTNPQLKSFKAKYGLETENDKNDTLKPVIVEFLVNNLEATFD